MVSKEPSAEQLAAVLEAVFDRSPLARIPEWIEAGKAPPAKVLRDQGFTTASTDAERYAELRLARRVFVRRYGFSIPCSEVMGVLSRMGPLVELGAGSGYWSALLRNAGLDVVATDPFAGRESGYGFEGGRHAGIERLGGLQAVEAYPDRDLFCSWPTEGSPWALAAVRRMRIGRRIALIGEPRGGCTATPGLYRYLETRFRLLGAIDIPQFPKVADRFFVYQRVR